MVKANKCGGEIMITSARAGAEASVKSLLPTLRQVRLELVIRDFNIGWIPSSPSLNTKISAAT